MIADWQPRFCSACGAVLAPATGDQVHCAACGVSWLRAPTGGGRRAVRGLRLRQVEITDPQGDGAVAMRALAPAGWRAEGGVVWDLGRPGRPAALDWRIADPSGPTMLAIRPTVSCIWSDQPMMQASLPVGSHWLGDEVRPPLDAVAGLEHLIVRRVLAGISALQIVERRPLAWEGVALQSAAGVIGAAQVRARYTLDGVAVEEVFQGVLTGFRSPLGYGTQVLWAIDQVVSLRAAAGALEAGLPLLRAFSQSLQLDAAFYQRVMAVSQHLITGQMRQTHEIAQLSRFLSQNNQAVSEIIVHGHAARQQVMDRVAQTFSQAIRGVQAYHDPHRGAAVELPGGYRFAWGNAAGEYVVTDDASFDPASASGQQWQRLPRA